MGFWDTFVKVWQVRTSIKIQESLEDYFVHAKSNAETKSNIPKIVDDVNKKNLSWNKKINHYRKKH
jgi:hypothetical protein